MEISNQIVEIRNKTEEIKTLLNLIESADDHARLDDAIKFLGDLTRVSCSLDYECRYLQGLFYSEKNIKADEERNPVSEADFVFWGDERN